MELPAAFQLWSRKAREFGFVDFVTPEDAFSTCFLKQAPWRNKDACGIYFWIAENGETYVGQTVNARARLLEHWRHHRDISYACFQPVEREELDRTELTLIKRIGRVFATRNIKHAFETHTHVPLDDFITDEERMSFLAGRVDLHAFGWRELPVLMQKQQRKFELLVESSGSVTAIDALACYLRSAIPKAATTEARFWSLTIFPDQRFLRLNVGQQEVFTVAWDDTGCGEARVLTGRRIGFFRSKRTSYQVESYVQTVQVRRLRSWLTGAPLLAARELVVRLMRHTNALNANSHCPQIVRAAVS